jgi:hypothetical protein
MKLVKKASGKTTIKMSRSEWTDINSDELSEDKQNAEWESSSEEERTKIQWRNINKDIKKHMDALSPDQQKRLGELSTMYDIGMMDSSKLSRALMEEEIHMVPWLNYIVTKAKISNL